MAMMMPGPGPQMGQANQPQQAGEGGGNVIENVDTMLGALGNAIQQVPNGGELAKRLEALRNEYRDIMTQASEMASSGGGAKGQQPMPSVPKSSPIPDRRMGMPQSPAGPY